ncbi:polysaccharide deacetylase [Campylobacter iguaniorum]|uniref:polysaccharide deacetylase family protein n=1 Tax=Campylobacter iguaniorum TaxID=1244531 RepID=UPI00073A2995|nr:polysaccharide deacetylase family protein [Campylobacter iguaniorum]ALV25404.1 polysaccharide deacetylase [Campylobacter iguaniorum]
MRTLLLLCAFFTWVFADAHIFIYHRFDDARHPSTSISSQALRNQFNYFKQNGYKVVKLDEIIKKVEAKEEVPDNWVALSVDDSYKSFYENGLPIFREFGYPFTLFIYVEASQKGYGDFMSFEQIKRSAEYGDIAYHSYSHPHMTHLEREELRRDFTLGLEVFEANLGFKPKYFSYPYGEFDENVAKIAESYGFKAIFNQNLGAVSKDSNLSSLDRIALFSDTNLKSNLASKYLKAEFIEPKVYPKDGNLAKIIARIDTNSSKVSLYISGLGSKEVEVKNGIIEVDIDQKITKDRVRIIINDKLKTATQIITKDKNAK